MISRESLFPLTIGVIILVVYSLWKFGFNFVTDLFVAYTVVLSFVALFVYVIFVSLDTIDIFVKEETKVSQEYMRSIITGIGSGLIVLMLGDFERDSVFSFTYWLEALIIVAAIFAIIAVSLAIYVIIHQDTDINLRKFNGE